MYSFVIYNLIVLFGIDKKSAEAPHLRM